MSRRRDSQGQLVPICEVDGCMVAAIGAGRCVEHIAPLISAAGRRNVPAEEPGRSETLAAGTSVGGRYG